MTPLSIDVADLTFHYELHSQKAVDHVSFNVAPGSITGLFGRNGSGKSTVSMLAAGLLHPTSGTVEVGGQTVYENADLMASICYISDSTPVFEDQKASKTLELWKASRPCWDADYAKELLDMFKIDPKKRPSRLSRGQLSSFYAVLGLACRCPITIFDEVHLGMDPVAREMFYMALLADYTKHPRTFILSSHLIEEIEDLLDSVILMDEGKIIEGGDVDEVRSRHSDEDKVAHLNEILVKMTLSSNDAEHMNVQKGSKI